MFTRTALSTHFSNYQVTDFERADLDHGPTLLKELQAFQVTLSERGHVGFEGKGEHDDLVIAVALAHGF